MSLICLALYHLLWCDIKKSAKSCPWGAYAIKDGIRNIFQIIKNNKSNMWVNAKGCDKTYVF